MKKEPRNDCKDQLIALGTRLRFDSRRMIISHRKNRVYFLLIFYLSNESSKEYRGYHKVRGSGQLVKNAGIFKCILTSLLKSC